MASADSFIFWCASSVDEDEDIGFEDEMPPDDDQKYADDPKGKGKARESMYVSLVEGMHRNEPRVFSLLTRARRHG